MHKQANRRILLIDDLAAIHDDFRKILCGDAGNVALDAAEALLFGEQAAREAGPAFTLDCASQGQEGLALVQAALQAGRPYALAFVDMRMPPGWDGLETIGHLWQADPALQVVICTAHSDHSWEEVTTTLDAHDRLLILKKPFDAIEVRQMASALTEKWNLARSAECRLDELQCRLLQSEKLASLGLLAAGVAHEINNPLAFLASNFGVLETYHEALFCMLDACEAALGAQGDAGLVAQLERDQARLGIRRLRADTPLLMAQSRDGMQRVSRIVKSLKDFSRVESGNSWEKADLHAGIESTLHIIAAQLRAAGAVVKEYGQLPLVECQPMELNQVFLNLLVNAAQAAGAGGKGAITIRTRMEGGHAVVEIADNGCGIPSDVLPRIFDPFFTTKPIGKGTGLGLSISHGIVRRHDGRIEVESQPDRGTRFSVYLPLQARTGTLQEEAFHGSIA